MLKPQRNLHRELVCLDGFWDFRPDPDATGEKLGWPTRFEAASQLAVPGSWNEQQTDLERFFGRGWYAIEFDAPSAWNHRSVLLHVGCAQNHARVWLNGHLVGEHRGGCLPFVCELAAKLQLGAPNRLTIEVDGSLNPWDIPAARIEAAAPEGFHHSNPAITYDFFPYCGIARSVHLEVTSTRARIETVIPDYTLDLATRTAALSIKVFCRDAAGATVSASIEDAHGTATLDANGHATIELTARDLRLWDVAQPELYRLNISLARDNRVLDSYGQTIGFRKVEVTGDAFLLNGRKIFLNGFGKHEDFPLCGRAMPRPAIVRDFDLMKWVGANSFRTSHYPYSEEWYDYADRHGVLVIGESPLVGLCTRLFESADVLHRARGVIRDMIERDRHHPSVVLWSVANEPWIETKSGDAFMLELLAQARATDPFRPVTYVAHMDVEHNAPSAHCDIVCLNKYYGWYESPADIEKGTEQLGDMLDAFHKAFGKPMIFSEFGADAVAGMHTLPSAMFSEEFQAEIIETQYREARRRPWIVGAHVWAFADFKTPQSITRVARNHKGIFTRERAPKLAAHALRRLWTEFNAR